MSAAQGQTAGTVRRGGEVAPSGRGHGEEQVVHSIYATSVHPQQVYAPLPPWAPTTAPQVKLATCRAVAVPTRRASTTRSEVQRYDVAGKDRGRDTDDTVAKMMHTGPTEMKGDVHELGTCPPVFLERVEDDQKTNTDGTDDYYEAEQQ